MELGVCVFKERDAHDIRRKKRDARKEREIEKSRKNWINLTNDVTVPEKHVWRVTSQIMTGHCLVQTCLRHPEQFEHQCFWVCGTQHFDPASSASVSVGELRQMLNALPQVGHFSSVLCDTFLVVLKSLCWQKL